jgi:hypothetical protein
LALVPGSLPDGSDSRVIASEPYRAKVNVLGRADLKIQSSWGRAVYDPLATSATESMINSPLGLTEGENGMIYFFDGLNNVIRKVDPNGQISWVAGHPGAPRVAGPDLDRLNGTTPVSFADAFLDGTQYTIGYRLHLHYMSGTHSLILGDGNTGRIRSLNLDQKLIRSPLMGTNRWSVWGLAVTPPGAATQGIVASRYRPSGLFASQIFWTSLADDANSTRMIGNDNPKCTDTRNPYCSPLEAPVPGVAINSNLSGIVIATAMDTEMNYYFADPGRGAILATATTPAVPAVPSGFYKIDQAGNLTRFLSGTSIQSIALFEDADGSKHFFSSDGSERLKYFSIAAGTGVATAPKALCLPGAYLNSAFYLAPTTGVHERNLLISDTKNNRILKYYIRDSKGDLALNFNASCK